MSSPGAGSSSGTAAAASTPEAGSSLGAAGAASIPDAGFSAAAAGAAALRGSGTCRGGSGLQTAVRISLRSCTFGDLNYIDPLENVHVEYL